MIKACKVCLIEKPLSDYYSAKGCKDGTWHTCKSCVLIKQNAYNNLRKDVRKKQAAKRYVENKEAILSKNKKLAENNRHIIRLHVKKWQDNNPEKKKLYYLKNKDRILKKGNEWSKKKESIDPIYKLKKRLRNRVSGFFRCKGVKKNNTTANLLGASYDLVKLHIERQFKKKMTWKNYGEWHVDHIIPLSSAKTKEDLIKLCHYTNLQPLWASDNVKKSSKIPQVQIKLTI